MTLLQQALEYRNKHNFSVIPVGKTKKPIIKWEEFQKRIATEEEIKKWWSDYPDANIGIVTGIISGIAVIDIDTDEGKEAIQDYIPDSLITPTVETPRGGQHLYFKCTDAKLTNNARGIKGCDLRANGGYVVAPPSVNGKGSAYAWVVSLKEDIALLPTEYIIYIKNILSSSYRESVDKNPQMSTLSTSVHKMFNDGTRDEDLFHVANAMVKGGMPEQEISQVLEILMDSWGEANDWKWRQAKIESALKRSERKIENFAQEIRDWVLSTTGHFLSTECPLCPQVSTRQEKKNLSEVLRRLVIEGLIERVGNRNGCFRLIDKSYNKIDFLNAPDEPINIKWPFEIEEYALIYPGNIIIVAGLSNAGKTAFLLNLVEMNLKIHKMVYQSSEMGGTELRNRLKKLPSHSLAEFQNNVDWRDKSSDWWDSVDPEAINIIDYMEIHEEHYKIGAWIKKIFDKLTNGIAIIAIQKKAGTTMGVGGAVTLEKPRLYLSIDFNEIRMVKAKNWTNGGINPNGLVLNYELYQGVIFERTKNWHKEETKK